MYPSGVASLDKVHTDTTGNAADEEIAKAVVDATAKDTSQLGSSDAVVEKGMHDGLDSAADLTAQAHAEMMKLLDMDILVVPPNSLNWIPQTKELEGILAILREHANNTIRNIEQLLSTFRIGGMEFSDGSLVGQLQVLIQEATERLQRHAQAMMKMLQDLVALEMLCIDMSLQLDNVNLVEVFHEAFVQVIQLVRLLCQKMQEAHDKAYVALATIGNASRDQMLKARQEMEALLSSTYEKLVTEACSEMAKFIVVMDGIATRVNEAASASTDALQHVTEEAQREIKELLPSISKLHLDIDVGFDAKMRNAIKAISNFMQKVQKEIEKASVVPGCCQIQLPMLSPFASMAKIFFGFCQIVSTFSNTFPSVPWPASFVGAWNAVSVVVNLNLFDAFSPECATGSFTFYDQLLVTVFGFALCLLLISGVSRIRYCSAEDDVTQRQVNNQGWRAVFLFLFAVFPSVNATLLQVTTHDVL